MNAAANLDADIGAEGKEGNAAQVPGDGKEPTVESHAWRAMRPGQVWAWAHHIIER
jgi:hypothetical protein